MCPYKHPNDSVVLHPSPSPQLLPHCPPPHPPTFPLQKSRRKWQQKAHTGFSAVGKFSNSPPPSRYCTKPTLSRFLSINIYSAVYTCSIHGNKFSKFLAHLWNPQTPNHNMIISTLEKHFSLKFNQMLFPCPHQHSNKFVWYFCVCIK